MILVSFKSPKDVLVDLKKSSPALEEVNEQFRHVALRLSIFSFYETLPTRIGPKKLVVLGKESSVLGYPGEISKPLNADHHDVCKYISQEDSNYICVRNTLKTLVRNLGPRGMSGQTRIGNPSASPYSCAFSIPATDVLESQSTEEAKLVEQFFASSQASEDDFAFLRQRWMPGTCQWILSDPTFKFWLEDTTESRVVWLNAPPGSGKSILSAYIINHMYELGRHCQYFIFKFGDCTKRSVSTFLKSIGLQLAKDVPAFRREMAKLLRKGVTLDKKDARFIWQKIFTSALSQMMLPVPLYWIIDALDESDSSKDILEFFQSLSTFSTPVRIFVLSRKTESLSIAFDRLSVSLPVDTVQQNRQENLTRDIQMYVEHELEYMRGTKDLKSQVKDSVLHRADGSFLWVHLVLNEILSCHTKQAIEQTLEEIPAGMSALYQRMELAIANSSREADRILAKTLLSWIVCARRPLTLKELSQALIPEFPEFLDLKRTIQDVCGQFVVVDRNSHVAMVHTTARDYLTRTSSLQSFISKKESHSKLFAKTISFLLCPDLHSKLRRNLQAICPTEPFLPYAATSFMYHLQEAATASEDMMDKLVMFFKGSSVLTWIHSLALCRQLEVLVTTARALTWFAGLKGKLNSEQNPLLYRQKDLELFELWATDLVKILAKFGRNLLDDPTAIYKIIPPLCPRDSIISRQFGTDKISTLSVSGISNTIWNDCLARITLQNGTKAWKISCANKHIAVLTSIGSITIWDSVNFEETCTMHHAELVSQMCFNSTCDKLVSYGFKQTKIWAIPSGQLVANILNMSNSKALAITFAKNDTKIMVASEDKLVRHLCINAVEEGWHVIDPNFLKENSPVEGGFITSPSFMSFNADATQIAVAYRGYPLSVWAIHEPRLIGRCRRLTKYRLDHVRPSPSVSWMAVDRIAWNPVTDHIVGLYKDGCVFKWDPISDETHEAPTIADEIQVSPDGKLFVTSDPNGTVKIWNFAHFSVIHQLSSENLVTGLAFSPDCKRFYDLRGSSINAWEPNSLIRYSDNGEIVSDTVSDTASDFQTSTTTSQMTEAWVVSIDPITALCAPIGSLLYCASYENGTVNLFDRQKGKLLEVTVSPAFLTMDHLVWGKDGMHIAAADLGGNFVIKVLVFPPAGIEATKLKAQTLLSNKAKVVVGGIHQILLNWDSTKLLIVSQDFGQIWSTETGGIIFSGAFERGETRKWINHPLEKNLLIGVGSKDLEVVDWKDLAGVTSFKYRSYLGDRSSLDAKDSLYSSISQLSLHPSSGFREDIYVHKAILTQDGQYLLVQIYQSTSPGRSLKRVLIFEISCLQCSDPTSLPNFLDSLELSREAMKIIEFPLGILPGKSLVFLDKDLWVCSLGLDSIRQPHALKRHYFVPRDWASTESLEQCCLLQDGTLLFPKDGEVAVITSNLFEMSW